MTGWTLLQIRSARGLRPRVVIRPTAFRCALFTVSLALLAAAAPAGAQMPDMAQMQKWAAVTIVHYEGTGVANDTHVQIPAADADQYGDVEERLTGVRKHPDTMVAESCGSGRKLYNAADKPVTMWIGPPDPMMLAMGAGGPVKISPDGKSMIMTALNDNWVWTYTPSAKK